MEQSKSKTRRAIWPMLALTVVVVWHIYNSVFSPEVFPIDRCMFSGRISRERMMHEHPLEYEQLTGQSGRVNPLSSRTCNTCRTADPAGIR